jgi:hypothetical protein
MIFKMPMQQFEEKRLQQSTGLRYSARRMMMTSAQVAPIQLVAMVMIGALYVIDSPASAGTEFDFLYRGYTW